VQKPAPHRDKPGGGERREARPVVQKPAPHRDKPGGGTSAQLPKNVGRQLTRAQVNFHGDLYS
jgi:hypothetical protein